MKDEVPKGRQRMSMCECVELEGVEAEITVTLLQSSFNLCAGIQKVKGHTDSQHRATLKKLPGCFMRLNTKLLSQAMLRLNT